MTNDALELSDKCETASSSARFMAKFVAHRVCPVVYLEVFKLVHCAAAGSSLTKSTCAPFVAHRTN